jgi:hypothetical protein
MLAAALIVKRYLPDLRSATATPPHVADHEAAAAAVASASDARQSPARSTGPRPPIGEGAR